MNVPNIRWAALTVLVWLAHQATAPGVEKSLDYGRDLFHRNWQERDPISPDYADGLGPLFNATSCVACHNQGNVGGGGGNRHNVQLLTMTTVASLGLPDALQSEPFDDAKFRKSPPHPAFATQSSVVLHRFSHPEGRTALERRMLADFAALRARWTAADPVTILGTIDNPLLGRVLTRQKRMARDAPLVALMRTERNTPALFGLGRIDQIPVSVLEQLARQQTARFPETKGRVAPGGGKFGWRGQTARLRDFVLGACANELGLQTPGNPQPEFRPPLNRPGDPGLHSDMYPEQIEALVNYVADLEPPRQVLPEGTSAARSWKRGEIYFSMARCDACHVEKVYHVTGLYSDLLLHDMGPELSDPAALSPSPSDRGYYGTALDFIIVSSEQKQQWRTPPLWGVRFSAPYLHDGRARTLEEAILLHGGEAALSKRRYEGLKPRERAELIAYVESLGAPPPEGTLIARQEGQ